MSEKDPLWVAEKIGAAKRAHENGEWDRFRAVVDELADYADARRGSQ